jgi:two-component system, NtrC family, response regulator PilR
MPKLSESKILVVDDEPIVLRSCARILAGYEVHLARSGPEGLERLKAERFDLVLTDLKMPGVSGLEILREARRARPGTRVVLMTGFGAEVAKEEVGELDPDSIVPKPFTPEELLEAVRKTLRSRAPG